LALSAVSIDVVETEMSATNESAPPISHGTKGTIRRLSTLSSLPVDRPVRGPQSSSSHDINEDVLLES
jgi:hypothetical protein